MVGDMMRGIVKKVMDCEGDADMDRVDRTITAKM